ncbi:hypothetical protein KEJ47_06345 [Candidatus Bathyarchaeota archaeon]|nr:hypothetical protein [Candidatus Bathyarchaeota archaeon]
MCQLAAYSGDRMKSQLLLKAIELQEAYFGGHASGLGVVSDGCIRMEKDVGPVERVRKTTRIGELDGSVGIAHSRWGYGFFDPRYNTKKMAHPFMDCNGSLCLMHNGNIANFKQHWDHLKERHPFSSYERGIDAITDSEVVVHMIEEQMDKGLKVGEALRKIAPKLTGSFLLACITVEEPDTVWIANWYQPCVIGVGDSEAMFCSSPIGFEEVRGEFNSIFEPPKNALIKMTFRGVEISLLDRRRQVPDLRLDRSVLEAEILEVLKRRSPIDFRDLWYELYPLGWARAYGVKPEEFEKLREMGVSIVNPYIGTLDEMASKGRIKRWIAKRPEAGVEYVPRYTYSL